VRFLGKVDRVSDILRASDLFLLPSAQESFGLAALEAMACGVPVVASRAGGLPELVADGVSGYLAPVGAVAELTERAVSVLRDGEQQQRMAQRAAERALDFTAERVVPLYERLYQDLLNE
jgi:glycosyltransferase involved in cell wall biosynthesis